MTLTGRPPTRALLNLRCASILACVLLASCATPPPSTSSFAASATSDHQEQFQKIKEYWTIKDPTPEDKALEETKMLAYYTGLVRSIKSLDDSSTAADVVAKAAISENIKELREWKGAQLANVARTNEYGARKVDQALNQLPSEGLLNEATSLVLRNRAGNLPETSPSR